MDARPCVEIDIRLTACSAIEIGQAGAELGQAQHNLGLVWSSQEKFTEKRKFWGQLDVGLVLAFLGRI